MRNHLGYHEHIQLSHYYTSKWLPVKPEKHHYSSTNVINDIFLKYVFFYIIDDRISGNIMFHFVSYQ